MSNKGSSGEIGYDAFLNHSSGGGGGAFLKSWRDDGAIDVWSHPLALPGVRWAHSFWELKKFKKKAKGGETEEEELFSYRWICHEREAILKRQKYRDDTIGRAEDKNSQNPIARCGGIIGNGHREYPPEDCPICLFIEYVRDAVRDGRIHWTAPLFEWKLSDGTDSEVISVGGFCGLYGRATNDYSEEQLKQLRQAGVERDEAFMENATARCDYLLRVIDAGNPTEGCVIAQVADTLGRRVQKAFKDRIEQTKGAFNPQKTPLCMRWKYDEKESFEKKYDLVMLPEVQPSADVLEALEANPPSISDLLAPGNATTLRAQMEAHCVVEGVPWDKFFGAAQTTQATDAAKGPGNEPWDKKPEPAPTSPAPTRTAQPAPTPTAPATTPEPASNEEFVCDVCSGPNSDPAKCRHCGSEYDPETGSLTYDATKPVGAGNMPRVTQPAAASTVQPVSAPAETPPPAGRTPARRRGRG